MTRDEGRRASVQGGPCVVEGGLGSCDGELRPWGGRLGSGNGIAVEPRPHF